MKDSFLDLYSVYKEKMNELCDQDDFFDYMYETIETGKSSFSLFNRFFEKKIDLRWVETIESCIIPLDTIIRNPRKFIVQEEEIVPIERARKITAESVRHLAQHTNMIARVEEDTVTPHHILNVFREESFEIYENRFIFTLVKQLEWFIDERYNALFNMSNDDNMSSLKMESSVQKGSELITFKMEMASQMSGNAMTDSKNESVFERIRHLKRVIDEFAHSKFMHEMKGCTPVRPPIMRTNVILKDPNFRACLVLWQFISSYDEVGYEINVKEGDEMVSDEYRDDLYRLMSVNYMLLKKNQKQENQLDKVRKRKIKPKFLKRLAEELVLDYDMDEAEIRRVFVDEMKRATKKKTEGEKKIKEAIDRCITSEQERKAAILEKIRLEIERQKEIERRKKEREEARIAREKALAKERKEKERARLKAKKEKELALARERAAKEKEKQRLAKLKAAQQEKERKEKERLAKEKEKERLIALKEAELERQRKLAEAEKKRIQKEKEEQLAREKAEKEKQRERERLAKERADRLKKERIAREKAKEKERLAKEKADRLEKERIAKEKAKEKERLAKEKAARLEKERIAKEKAKEQERLAKEKAVRLEKEKIAKERAKERERLAREKAIAAAKEQERLAKEKARARAEAERQRAKEKAELAKQKAKERERLAREKATAAAKEKERIAKEKAKAKLDAEKQKPKEKQYNNAEKQDV